MTKPKQAHGGFTLIELIVVIALVSIMLLFAVPNFSAFFSSDSTSGALRWLIVKIRVLKTSAVREQKLYILHADMDTDQFWITDESMTTEEEKAAAMEQGLSLPDDVEIADVEFPRTGRVPEGTVEIAFYKRGYSDRAVIHLEEDGGKSTSVFVEPFLSTVKVVDTYQGYDVDGLF